MSLAALTAFADAEPGLIAALNAALEPFSARAGEVLFRQNDPAEGLQLVTAGRIAVQGRTLADGLVDLAEVGAGDILGELSLIDQDGRRSATATALEPVEGFFLSREA